MREFVRHCLMGLSLLLWENSPASARLTKYPAPDRELMVPVKGGRVYVRINGPLNNGRPPLVMVHGGPGGTHGSGLEAVALATDRAVILYDQLGSGRSDRPTDPANWTVKRFVDELDAVRSALNIPRWYVVGHSWGGTIALEYAARRPRELAGVVLASPLISTRSWISDANLLRAPLPRETQATLTQCEDKSPPPAKICDAATGVFYAQYNGRDRTPRPYKAPANAADKGFNADLYNRMWGSSEFVATGTLKNYDGEPLLARLYGRHTLFVAGQYDEARPVTMLGFASRVKDAEYAIIPGAAHSLFGDRPDETVAILSGWLKRQDRHSEARR